LISKISVHNVSVNLGENRDERGREGVRELPESWFSSSSFFLSFFKFIIVCEREFPPERVRGIRSMSVVFINVTIFRD